MYLNRCVYALITLYEAIKFEAYVNSGIIDDVLARIVNSDWNTYAEIKSVSCPHVCEINLDYIRLNNIYAMELYNVSGCRFAPFYPDYVLFTHNLKCLILTVMRYYWLFLNSEVLTLKMLRRKFCVPQIECSHSFYFICKDLESGSASTTPLATPILLKVQDTPLAATMYCDNCWPLKSSLANQRRSSQ